MKVLFVANNISVRGNGICTSARNTVKHLREKGIDARTLAGANKDPKGEQPDFVLDRLYFPIFQPIIDANGFSYAKIQKDRIRKAIEWADVVHIEEPLFMEAAAIKIARKLGKPLVATFHLYTENILSEIPLANWKWSNNIMMYDWRKNFFNHCSHVQCPSQTVKNLLEEYHFASKLHVISNGIRIPEEKVVAKPLEGAPYLILNVGRYATKKGQITLLKAMRFSRHAKDIQLHLAGEGVMHNRLKKEADALIKEGVLVHKPIFAFHNAAELKELAQQAYLYVHCATIEVEGLGCMESLREGTVPVIAKGRLVATSDFALDDRSTFEVSNPKDLAAKIDWWIEHPQERNRMAQVYADKARDYDIHKSIDALIEMYKEAIADNRR